jgi:hypothetical protein
MPSDNLPPCAKHHKQPGGAEIQVILSDQQKHLNEHPLIQGGRAIAKTLRVHSTARRCGSLSELF